MAVREIVFDTETTGFNPMDGHKVVEIGAVELINHMPTGNYYHQYINPHREMPEEAYNVHGLSEEFLRGHPGFSEVAADFLEFIGDADLIAHNASFDMNFINYELKTIGRAQLTNNVIDTLNMAKNLFPGAKNNLDALCKRYGVDNSERTNHGALLDSELLAKVYLEMIGGQEPTMEFENKALKKDVYASKANNNEIRESRNYKVSGDDIVSHEEFLKKTLKLEEVW